MDKAQKFHEYIHSNSYFKNSSSEEPVKLKSLMYKGNSALKMALFIALKWPRPGKTLHFSHLDFFVFIAFMSENIANGWISDHIQSELQDKKSVNITLFIFETENMCL